MLAEFLDKLSELVDRKNRLFIEKAAAEPAHVYYTVDHNGKAQLCRAEPTPRDHKAFSLDTINELVKLPSNEVIWYSREGVVLIHDDASRRDRTTFKLTCSKPLLALQYFFGKQIKQAELIRLLRTVFRNCLGPTGEIISVLRNVRFQVNEGGASEVQHGKSSIGRSMLAEIHGLGALPEYLKFSIPIFEQFNFAETVEVALEPDPATQTFQLLEVSGQVEDALQSGEEFLRSQITADCPVLLGKP